MDRTPQTSPEGYDSVLRETFAMLSHGLSHPVRVEIIRMLTNRPEDMPCICSDIVRALPLAQSTVSQHLRLLRETGWITGETVGTSVHYCLREGVLDEYRGLLDRVLAKDTGPRLGRAHHAGGEEGD
ncbi:MAG TPA: metalloregulator ArsR/SmtB family transcription factor [Deltaproteobacteria bacterium]|nr:metalloregulator ArsR/SmtB family transcription factor [Deltaproteobacteria bacterium]